MADNILKLKVDSDEYNNKLKTAGEQLQRYIDGCRKAGGTLEYVDEGVQDFIKGLGQMETKATSARGKLSEMTKVFTDMKLAYLQMTDAEKHGEPGKALSASLDQLKGRIIDAKKNLADVNKELGDTGKESQSTGNILEQLAGKFGINTKALTTWGAAIGAGAAALKVAKDAFFASEQNLDDWNRMVYSSQSTYEAFLTSLNTGDVSGFLNNINTIVQTANDAYDAIDRLQTTQNIQAPQMAKKQAEIQRMETMLRTGRWVGAIDGRKSPLGLKDGDILTKAQKDRITKQLESAIMELAGLTRKEVVRANDAVDKMYNNLALSLNMSKQKFMAGISTIDTFEYNVNQGKKYQEWEANRKLVIGLAQSQPGYSRMLSAEQKKYINTTNPYEAYKGWNVFKDDGEQYQQAIQMIQNSTAKEQQYYSEIARAYRQINRVEGYKPYGGGTGSQLTDPEEAQQKYEQALKDYNQALEQAALETKAGTVSTVDAKKKELSAEETLWKAIGDAREIYDTDQLKQEQDKVAAKVVELGGSVNALVEEQKAAQEAARELAAAQKKVAAALEEASTAYSTNDLKGYMSALNKVGGDVTAGIQSGNFSYTKGNMAAFISYLNDRLSKADYGTVLFGKLTAQLADAKSLANLMETAVKNGIDIAQFDPQALFDKIFSSTPGDYIDNIDWKSIQDAINEKLKEMDLDPIELDFNTGDINNDKKTKEKEIDGTKQFRSLVGDVSTIVGSLNQLGIDVPEGFQKTLGVMQVVTTILMTLQSLAGITATTSAVKSIPIIGWFLQNGGVVHAADGWSGIVPGTHMSGDQVPAMLNSGELVLNKAQSGVIASALTSAENGSGGGVAETRIESDQMVLLLRNGAARRGQTIGEYLGL